MIMKNNKTNLFVKVLLSTIMLLSVSVFAVDEILAAIAATTPAGRTYVSENGQIYDADAMQGDYSSLASEVQILGESETGNFFSSFMPSDKSNSWFKTQFGFWYYFINNRTETQKGWFDDPADGQRYYLDPTNNGVMLVGWQFIDGNWYYFNESHNNEVNWYDTGNGWYESLGKQVVAYGSLLRNGIARDGRSTDNDGKLKEEQTIGGGNIGIGIGGGNIGIGIGGGNIGIGIGDGNENWGGSGNKFSKKLENEYKNNQNNAKFDNNGNLWILSVNEVLNGPGERITIKYTTGNKTEIYERSGYSSPYGGHTDEYLTILNGIKKEEAVNEYRGDVQGETAQLVNSIFLQYYQMIDSYSNLNIDHISAKELDKMDVSKVLDDLSKEDKTLIRNEDGTYSSTSKKKASKYYKDYMKDIINDKEVSKKHQEQLIKDIDEGNPVIVTDEMMEAGLYMPIS